MFLKEGFLFRQEFSFSQSYRFFPSFCQALAEDRVTTPTKKKIMVNVTANRVTSELGGEGVAVCPEGLISWVFTPVLRECGVMIKGGCHFYYKH